MGSVVLPHLNTGWHVDQAILSEDERVVVIRFGRDSDRDCMRQDEILYRIADKVKNFAVMQVDDYCPYMELTANPRCSYLCDLDLVSDFNAMYELVDPMTIMFFFRNSMYTLSASHPIICHG